MTRRTLTLMIVFAILSLTLATFSLAGLVWALEAPSNATVMDVHPLPCGGAVVTYDGNQDPEDGPEWITIHVQGESSPRAVIEYGVGKEGKFIRAQVLIPGGLVETFDSPEAIKVKYPTPCDVVRAEGPEKA